MDTLPNRSFATTPGAANRIEAARVFLAGIADNPSTYDLALRPNPAGGGVVALRQLLETSRRAAGRSEAEQEWAALSLALGLAEETFEPAHPEFAEATSARWFYLWDQVESASPESEAFRCLDEVLEWGRFENHAAARDLFADAAEILSPRDGGARSSNGRSSAPRPQAHTLRLAPNLIPKLVPRVPESVVEVDWENLDAPGEGAESKTTGRSAWRWKAALVAGVCGGVFLPLAAASRSDQRQAGRTKAAETTEVYTAPFEAAVKPLPSPHEVALQFLDATSHNERAELLRDPRSAFAMRDHFERVAEQGIESERVDLVPMGEWFDHGTIFHPFRVRFADGNQRYLAVVDEPGGRYVDWDAYSRSGSASWGQLFGGEAESAEVRVVVRPDDFYNREFADTSKYECLQLTTPDVGGSIYGYVEHGSTTQKIIHDVFQRMRLDAQWRADRNGTTSAPVNDLPFTLSIRQLGDSREHRQFLIERVVAGSWVASSAGDLQNRWVDPGEDGTIDSFDEMIGRQMARRAEDQRQRSTPFGSGIGFSL